MSEFFLLGVLCILDLSSAMERCSFIEENPIKFYREAECKELAVKKVNEIGANLTSQGIKVTQLKIACVVDKDKLNT